ncbi:MAG: hypothetical protein ACEQSX_07780 [Baekduiaceae bacterium]
MANGQVDTGSDAGAFGAIVRRRAWIVVLAVLAALASAFIFTSLQEKQYKSTAVLLFRQVLLDVQLTGVPLVAPGNDATVESATNVGLVSQENVRVAAAARLGPGFTPSSLEDQLTIEPQKKSDLIGIEATADSPQEAARVANAVAASYLAIANEQSVSRINAAADRVRQTISSRRMSDSQRRELRRSLVKLNVLAQLGPQNVQLSQPAVPPRKASSPKPLLNLLIGGLVGLVIGIALAFGVEHFDRRLRKPEELERESGLPLLATVPRSASLKAPRGGTWVEDAEPFRQLASVLRHRADEREIRSVLLVAPSQGSGTTTVALYLALAAAEGAAAPVLLVEANLRRPVLGDVLGLPQDTGLTTLADDPQAAVQPIDLDGPARDVSVVLAGPAGGSPASVLESEAVTELLKGSRDAYDFAVVDGPPPLLVADVLPLIPEVDAVVIVARLGQDTGADVRRLRTELERQGAEPIGVVANGSRRRKNPYAA